MARHRRRKHVLITTTCTNEQVTIANKRVLNERAAPSTLLFLQQIVILLGFEFTSLIFGSRADRLPWSAKQQLVIATIPLAVLNCLALVLKTICLQVCLRLALLNRLSQHGEADRGYTALRPHSTSPQPSTRLCEASSSPSQFSSASSSCPTSLDSSQREVLPSL